MFRISKDFSFAAAHHLTAVPRDHKCARTHGHNYVVRVVAAATHLAEPGWVVDYGDLDALGKFIDMRLDHRDLNAVVANPTAEVLAEWLYEFCAAEFTQAHPGVAFAVGVAETPKTWAWYDPNRIGTC